MILTREVFKDKSKLTFVSKTKSYVDCTKTEYGFGVENAFDKNLRYDIASFVNEKYIFTYKKCRISHNLKKYIFFVFLTFLNSTQAPDLHSTKFCDLFFIPAEESDRPLFHIY